MFPAIKLSDFNIHISTAWVLTLNSLSTLYQKDGNFHSTLAML